MQAWAAVSATMNAKFLLYLFCKLGIFSVARAYRTLSPGIKTTFRNFKHATHDDHRKFSLVLFDKLVFYLCSREKMPTAFFRMSRYGTDPFEFTFQTTIFFFELSLMPFAWKGVFPMLRPFLAPSMTGSIRDTQLAGNLRDRLSAGLTQSDCFLFEFAWVGFLNLCHRDPLSGLIKYLSALGTLSNRGKFTSSHPRSYTISVKKIKSHTPRTLLRAQNASQTLQVSSSFIESV
jgi:hypothetical protein